MLNIEVIRSNPQAVKDAIRKKGFSLDLDQLLDVDDRRKKTRQRIDALREQRNKLSASIPQLKGDDKQRVIAESKQVGEELKKLEADGSSLDVEFGKLMLQVPNIPAPDVPEGKTDADNVEIRRWGEPRKFDFTPRDHTELALSLGLVNFDGPRKFAGGRSYALTGDGVLLEMAVLRFALEHVISKGFLAVAPPVMVKDIAMEGTGFFPIGREDAFTIEKDELYLTGTSEVGLVSLHRDDIFSDDQLPIRYVGISSCFRREAGAAGRDTKGFYRVYMFQKVEQVIFCVADPEVSQREHNLLLHNSEEILQLLKLPHRVALACTGELGMGQVRKHEIESWMPSRNTYSETHSCSTLHEFQSRRSNIRYRTAGAEKLPFVHTLNNTAIASPRILIPILENYQEADGTVTIPEVLRPYMNGRTRLEPRK